MSRCHMWNKGTLASISLNLKRVRASKWRIKAKASSYSSSRLSLTSTRPQLRSETAANCWPSLCCCWTELQDNIGSNSIVWISRWLYFRFVDSVTLCHRVFTDAKPLKFTVSRLSNLWFTSTQLQHLNTDLWKAALRPPHLCNTSSICRVWRFAVRMQAFAL